MTLVKLMNAILEFSNERRFPVLIDIVGMRFAAMRFKICL